MTETSYTAAFPKTDEQGWKALVETALKGGSFDRLVSKTVDGLAIQPLYPAAPQDQVITRAVRGPWIVSQRVDHPDADAANAQALEDLVNGTTGLTLVFAGAPSARGYGLSVTDAAGLDRVLADVYPELVQLRLESAPFASRPAARMLIDVLKARKLDVAALDVDFGADPIGDMARAGGLPADWDETGKRLAELARDIRAEGFSGPVLRADSRAVHEAGGSEAQELAFVIATGIAYLRALEANGFTPEEARGLLSFTLVADADEFLSLAKFRALRLLWARVEEAMGLAAKPVRLHGESAWRMMTKRDAHVNMLRATVAVFSAGLGGADSFTALPFTAPLGLPEAHARRIARNTQLILIEESNLDKVVDPAAGAGGFASLTQALCERAWEAFQEIEREGGIVASLIAGALQSRIATLADQRRKEIGRRKLPITGTSEFPNIREYEVEVLDAPRPAFEKAPLSVRAPALPSRRDGEDFEELRMAAEIAGTPKVFLANLGPIAGFTARATFAKNFYEAGGIEAIGNDGFADAAAVAEAFKVSGAKIACICSSDALYAERAEETARALKEAGARQVSLAGRPGDKEADYRAAGIEAFIYAGAELLGPLKEAQAKAA